VNYEEQQRQQRELERQQKEAERKQKADEANQRGLEASGRGDWNEAANRFMEALEFAPDSSEIRTNLERANASLADAGSAAEIVALRQRIEDSITAANIQAQRLSFAAKVTRAAIPAACLVADQLESSASCDVIDASRLGWNLAGANGDREMLRILGAEAAQRVVFMSFPSEMGVGARVSLVQKLYALEASEFAKLISRIQSAMQNDQQAARLRTEYAIRDSAAVAALWQSAADESRQSADTTSEYITTHSESSGITFHCDSACHQVIRAAQAINAFD
jgi:hypothetical protein